MNKIRAEQRKQILINSILKSIYVKLNNSKLNVSQASEFRKPTKIQQQSCAKEFEFPLLRIPQNVKTKNYERLVFEQAKDPIIQ